MKKKEEIVSIFSGMGIFDLGFHEYFDIVLSVEKEEIACKNLELSKKKFHPNMTVWNRDIYKIPDKEILKWFGVKGLIGGPPCQAFSPGKHGFDPTDERISGLAEFLRWVRLLEPEFFVFENTYGLMQGEKKQLFALFLEEAEKLGYVISAKILNANEHGNVQDRDRVFAIGVRNNVDWKFIFPEPIPEKDRKRVKDILRDEPLGECVFFSEQRASIMAYVPEGGNWRSLPSEELKAIAMGANYKNRKGGMTGAYRRLDRNKPCPTLTTNPLQRNTICAHPTENRPLSVAEYRRGMGLPDEYELIGSVNQKYKMLGNGVPMELAVAVAKAIVDSKRINIPAHIADEAMDELINSDYNA